MSNPVPQRANTLARITTRGAVSVDEASALNFVHRLETSDLQNLLEDETQLTNLLNDLDQIKQLRIDKQTLLASNKSLAEFNLTKRMPLMKGKENLNGLYSELKLMKVDVDSLSAQYDSKATVVNLETTHALLQAKAAQTEEESENVTDSFLTGGMDVDTFVEQYIAKKSKAHLQRIKAEKMAELIHQQSMGGSQPPARPSYNPYQAHG